MKLLWCYFSPLFLDTFLTVTIVKGYLTMQPTSAKSLALYNVGISYEKANTDIRGRFSLNSAAQEALLKEAKSLGLNALFVLSTCNRTEIMGFAHHPYELINLLLKHCQGSMDVFSEVAIIHKDTQAINHLFRTASGLNSQILGDHEIAGQLKLAFQQARDMGTVNVYLDRLFNTVLQASKEVKSCTQFSMGTTSVAYAAVKYLLDNIENTSEKNILLYGLGKIGKNTCKHLLTHTDSQISLINRTHATALKFQEELPSLIVHEESHLADAIQANDILIVSTGADKPTITPDLISPDRSLTILDLSIPENVAAEIKAFPNVTVMNVDALSKVTDATIENRQAKIPLVEKIIDNYQQEFLDWVAQRKLSPTIQALKQAFTDIQQKEIAGAARNIENFNPEQANVLSGRIIQKILNQFVTYLKDPNTSIDSSTQLIQDIFNLTESTNYEHH